MQNRSKNNLPDMVFHVGLQKTGSKTLQTYLLKHGKKNFHYARTGQAGFWHKDLFFGDHPDQIEVALTEQREMPTVISYEDGYRCRDDVLRAISSVNGTKVTVFFVRDLLSWLNSFRNQVIKSERTSLGDVQRVFATTNFVRDAYNFEKYIPRWKEVSDLKVLPYDKGTDTVAAFHKALGVSYEANPISRANFSLNRDGAKVFLHLKSKNLEQNAQIAISRELTRKHFSKFFSENTDLNFVRREEEIDLKKEAELVANWRGESSVHCIEQETTSIEKLLSEGLSEELHSIIRSAEEIVFRSC